MSLSIGAPGDATPPDVEAALQFAAARGVLLIAAAGNEGAEGLTSPSSDPLVLAVGCNDRNGNRCSFSAIGPELDISAAGLSVPVLTHDGGYANASGTSLSAPVVAAAAALLFSRHADASADDVKKALMASRDAPAGDNPVGELNVSAAMQYLDSR